MILKLIAVALATLACLATSAASSNGKPAWTWERYEAGITRTISMSGEAELRKKTTSGYVFQMRDPTGQIESFEVNVTLLRGGKVTASFIPPNTERFRLHLVGRHTVTARDRRELFVLTGPDNGNVLVIRSPAAP